jgi:Zn-dependent peptidase ImmA (M78 family)
MNGNYILSAAKEMAVQFDRDPYNAATENGAIVSFKDLGSLKGVFLSSLPKPTIIINNTIDSSMQKIVCAHELGHFILHKNQTFSCENTDLNSKTVSGKCEREANLFASAFLIDPEKVTDILKGGYTVAETAAILNTDVTLLLFLLNTMGLADVPDSSFLKR